VPAQADKVGGQDKMNWTKQGKHRFMDVVLFIFLAKSIFDG